MANESNSDLQKSELSMRTPEAGPSQFNIPHESPGNLEPMESIPETKTQTIDSLISDINVIKDQLNKLPLDTGEMEFISNKISPLLNILYQLSTTSYNLAGSANLLSISSIVKPKRSDLRDTVHLVYKINDECEDVYDVLKRRINFILENKQ